MSSKEVWNKCDECGKFISYKDFGKGATRKLASVDSDFSREAYETLCKKCTKE